MNLRLLVNRIIKLFYILKSSRFRKIFFCNGVLIAAEHKNIFYNEYKTIIDIGANKGQFSLAARYWLPDAKIIAFEPLPRAAEIYRRVFQEDQKVTIHQVAIGPEAGKSIIHISKADDFIISFTNYA